jgi:hypothetical protein
MSGSKRVERTVQGTEKGSHPRRYGSSKNVGKDMESCLFGQR